MEGTSFLRTMHNQGGGAILHFHTHTHTHTHTQKALYARAVFTDNWQRWIRQMWIYPWILINIYSSHEIHPFHERRALLLGDVIVGILHTINRSGGLNVNLVFDELRAFVMMIMAANIVSALNYLCAKQTKKQKQKTLAAFKIRQLATHVLSASTHTNCMRGCPFFSLFLSFLFLAHAQSAGAAREQIVFHRIPLRKRWVCERRKWSVLPVGSPIQVRRQGAN